MKKLIVLSLTALGLFGVANAALAQGDASAPKDYPLCSAQVRDECMNPSEAGAHEGGHHHHHHRHHH